MMMMMIIIFIIVDVDDAKNNDNHKHDDKDIIYLNRNLFTLKDANRKSLPGALTASDRVNVHRTGQEGEAVIANGRLCWPTQHLLTFNVNNFALQQLQG